MFTLAWLFLADQPAYRTGVIIVGLARCIAMVLIWNDLAKGDRDRTALLVVFNALFQVAAYSLLGYFYLTVLPGWLGLDTQGFEVGIWEVAKTVLIFLGIPLAAGFLTRRIGLKRKGRDWYDQKFIPRIGPITLYGLLFTIVVLFAIQGEKITAEPVDVARIALPLLVYFAVMWVAGFLIGKLIGLPYAQTASMGFTVASNDFELAIAVAVGVFGATSGEALAGVVGPLIEVPVLVALVYVALWARRYWRSDSTRPPVVQRGRLICPQDRAPTTGSLSSAVSQPTTRLIRPFYGPNGLAPRPSTSFAGRCSGVRVGPRRFAGDSCLDRVG